MVGCQPLKEWISQALKSLPLSGLKKTYLWFYVRDSSLDNDMLNYYQFCFTNERIELSVKVIHFVGHKEKIVV